LTTILQRGAVVERHDPGNKLPGDFRVSLRDTVSQAARENKVRPLLLSVSQIGIQKEINQIEPGERMGFPPGLTSAWVQPSPRASDAQRGGIFMVDERFLNLTQSAMVP